MDLLESLILTAAGWRLVTLGVHCAHGGGPEENLETPAEMNSPNILQSRRPWCGRKTKVVRGIFLFVNGSTRNLPLKSWPMLQLPKSYAMRPDQKVSFAYLTRSCIDV